MKASLFHGADDNVPKAWEGGPSAGDAWPAFCAALRASPMPPHPDPLGKADERAWKALKRSIPAWSPATFRPGGLRRADHVVQVHAFVVDLDDVPLDALGAVLDGFDSYEYLAHTSPGAVRCRPGQTRLRAIFPLASPVAGKDWERVWPALVQTLGLKGLDYVDGTCKGASWMYFLPCEGAHFLEHRGQRLEGIARERLTSDDLLVIAQGLRRRKDPDTQRIGRAMALVARGEMYAPDPHRDQTLRDITWHLAIARPATDPESLIRLFAPSMSAPGALPDDPDEERLVALFEGAVEKLGADGAPVVLDAKRMREAWCPVDRDTPLTDDETLGWDEHEWLLQHGKSVYLRGPLGYVGPFGADAQAAALTHLSPAPVQLYRTLANGGVRPKTVLELIESNGRAIRHAVVDLTAQRATYDREEDTYREAPCPLRSYPPIRHREVEAWLRLLAGSERGFEALVRWLHYLTRLEMPCAALYLTGPGDTGKTLFATECAKFWSTKGPTTIEGALDTFNDAIVTCPLVFGDEFVPTGSGDEIKRLISERDRPIKVKYQPVGRMLGCVRVILASNNYRLADQYKDLTLADVEALMDRFVALEVDPRAAEFLRSVDVGEWVRNGAIPSFISWCAAIEGILPEGRFLVRTPIGPNAMRRSIATRTGVRAQLCEWLASFVLSPRTGLAAAKGGLVIQATDDGPRLLVKAWAVRELWATYSRENQPRIGQLNQALGALSKGRTTLDYERYAEVDLDLFGLWCEENGSMDRAELRTRLDNVAKANQVTSTAGLTATN